MWKDVPGIYLTILRNHEHIIEGETHWDIFLEDFGFVNALFCTQILEFLFKI